MLRLREDLNPCSLPLIPPHKMKLLTKLFVTNVGCWRILLIPIYESTPTKELSTYYNNNKNKNKEKKTIQPVITTKP